MQPRKPESGPPISAALKPHLLGLRHVGHVVDDVDRAIADFRRVYGLSPEDVQRLPDQGAQTLARFAFVRVAGAEFELIEPVSEGQKQLLLGAPSGGGGINHVAWSVRDLDGALAALAAQGITPGWVTPVEL